MGAWSYEVFGNDDALGWLTELENASDLSIIEATLLSVLDQNAYLEAPLCSSALAAAEVVAALLGKPAPLLPSEVSSWIKDRPRPDIALVALARSAALAILTSSELQELWAESENYRQWQSEVEGLLVRLQ